MSTRCLPCYETRDLRPSPRWHEILPFSWCVSRPLSGFKPGSDRNTYPETEEPQSTRDWAEGSQRLHTSGDRQRAAPVFAVKYPTKTAAQRRGQIIFYSIQHSPSFMDISSLYRTIGGLLSSLQRGYRSGRGGLPPHCRRRGLLASQGPDLVPEKLAQPPTEATKPGGDW